MHSLHHLSLTIKIKMTMQNITQDFRADVLRFEKMRKEGKLNRAIKVFGLNRFNELNTAYKSGLAQKIIAEAK